MEFCADVRSLDEFQNLMLLNKNLLNPFVLDTIGQQILLSGFEEPLTGRLCLPTKIIQGAGWREGLICNKLSSRVRGVMHSIGEVIQQNSIEHPRIFAAEATTEFALTMRGIFPRFLGSEYTEDKWRKEWMYPIPLENLLELTLKSDAFDFVSTNEVLEHVPSIDKSLSEIHRVLRPGGWHVGTVPFLFFEKYSAKKALIDTDGAVKYLTEPEYHGDPMNLDGILVFELPGWDLISRALEAGFTDAFMRFLVSSKHGILSDHIGGVLIFCAIK